MGMHIQSDRISWRKDPESSWKRGQEHDASNEDLQKF